jgi:hypothetical protein
MAVAFKRTVRQAISAVIAATAAYGTWLYANESGIFHPFQGGDTILPGAAAVAAFFVAFYVAMMLLKSKAAR